MSEPSVNHSLDDATDSSSDFESGVEYSNSTAPDSLNYESIEPENAAPGANNRKKKRRIKRRKEVKSAAEAESRVEPRSIVLRHRWQRNKARSHNNRENVPDRAHMRNFLPTNNSGDALVMGEPTAVTCKEAELLIGYVKRARTESERFYRAADKNRKRHNWSRVIVLIILSITAGGSTLYNLLTPTDDGTFAYRITVNILLVISAVLQASQQTFRWEEKGTNYEMTGDDFFNYAREYEMRIAQGVDDRRDKCVDALTAARHGLREIELGALPL